MKNYFQKTLIYLSTFSTSSNNNNFYSSRERSESRSAYKTTGAKLLFSFAFFPFITNFWYALTRAQFDYGDAPATYAEARAKDVEKVWLGDSVDKEKAAKRVDGDNFDDGADIDWSVAGKGSAYFAVHKKVGIKGMAYLNLFVDFDKNGAWNGDEWVVKNMAVDLAAQDKNEVAPYSAEFAAPTDSKEGMWYRAIVSYEQQATADGGEGTFKVGEVEDYPASNAASTVPPYKFICDPAVLKINHGSGGTIGVSGFGFLSLANSVVQKNDDRTISVLPGGAKGTSIIYYKSKNIHPRDPQFELELVPVRVDIQGAQGVKLLSRIKYCPVVIKHDPLEPMRPVGGGDGEIPVPKKTIPTPKPPTAQTTTKPAITYKIPTFLSSFKKETTGNASAIIVSIKPQDVVGRRLTGIEIVTSGRNYSLPAPQGGSANVNQAGNAGWNCSATGEVFRCFGATPLEANKETLLVLQFGSDVMPPSYLSANILDDAGKKAIGLGVQFVK